MPTTLQKMTADSWTTICHQSYEQSIMMSSMVPTDASSAIYIRRQKATTAPVVHAKEDCDVSSFGVGVGMRSPSMQKIGKSFASHSSISNAGLVNSHLSAGSGLTKRVSFGLQHETVALNARERMQATPSTHDARTPHLGGDPIKSPQTLSRTSSVDADTFFDQSAFLNTFSSAPQRDIDTCVHFAMHGGPLVKYSSRAQRPPILCTFRLIGDCKRLVWAEASKPDDEKYGLETSSVVQVLVGAAAAAEFETLNKGSNVKTANMRLVLLLHGDEKLRLEALDKVSELVVVFYRASRRVCR